MTSYPVIIQTREEVECVLIESKKFCETIDSDPQELELFTLVSFGWMFLVLWVFFKFSDNLIDGNDFSSLALLSIFLFLLPFILLVILG